MASKGLRAISYQYTQKVEAGYIHLHTTETLIGYIVCWQLVFIHIRLFIIYIDLFTCRLLSLILVTQKNIYHFFLMLFYIIEYPL
jgi:hypothetical protein